jgi:Ricin-type beta-trefoil lectin domain
MAHIFDVTAAEEWVYPSASGTCEISFTVTNVSATAVSGRAVLRPENSPVLPWLRVMGEHERLLQPKHPETFLVKIAIPPGTKAGDYSFRLDMVSAARPYEDSTQGPAIKIPVTLASPAPKSFPKWILVVAAVVIVGLGFAAWKLISPSKVTVPDVQVGEAKPEASPPATPPPTAPVARITPPSGRAGISNSYSGFCLSPAGAQTDNNRQIVQYRCDGDPARLWTFHAVEGDVFQIVNSASQRCLTVAGGNTQPADPSVQYNCDEDASRRWHLVALDETTFHLVNVNSKMCLAIPGTDLNDIAVQNPCDPNDRFQEWRLNLAH